MIVWNHPEQFVAVLRPGILRSSSPVQMMHLIFVWLAFLLIDAYKNLKESYQSYRCLDLLKKVPASLGIL